MKKLKRFIRNHKYIMYILSFLYRMFMHNKIKGKKHLKIKQQGAFLKKCKVLNHGNNNILFIGEGCRINNSIIQFFGNNNQVILDNDCVLNGVNIWISDGGVVQIGHNTHFVGDVHIACIEQTSVQIGNRCLFSNAITIRTGDSHSILDANQKRINPSANVIIGNHVWIGNQVVILKNAHIGSDSVIGTRSLVTGGYFKDGCVLAGSPVKTLKEDINWDHRLL